MDSSPGPSDAPPPVAPGPVGRAALDQVPAPLLVLGAIASVQTGSAVARSFFDTLGATGITLLRLGFASLLLLAVVRPRPWRWSRPAQGAAVLLGLAMAGMNLVFYLAIDRVPLGIAVTVEFTGPLLVALVQTRRLLDAAWVLLAAAGVALLGLPGPGSAPLAGLALAALAGLFWGAYILASARVGQLLPGTGGLAVALGVATAVAFPFGIGGAAHLGEHPEAALAGLAVALLSSVVPYSLELAALRQIPTRVFGVLMSLEPGAAAVAGLLVLHQTLGPTELVALTLVSAASVGVTLARRADQMPPQPLE